MARVQTHRGFTLLELLITVVIIITLSIIGIQLANYFSFKYSQVPKVRDSLSTIHDAFKTCYYGDKHPELCASFDYLYQNNYLSQNQVFNITVGNEPVAADGKFYKYNLFVIHNGNDPDTLIISMETRADVHLQSLNPNQSYLKSKEYKGHKYQVYYYEWRYPLLLSQYKNRQGNSLIPKYYKLETIS